MSDANTSSIWGSLFRKREPWQETVTELWAATPFFRGIPLREIRRIVDNMHLRNFSVDEPIFHIGDQGAGAAIILSGVVEIRYKKTVLATLSRGDFFGEISLVLDERRTADATAIEDTELVFFLRPELDEWITQAPQHGARLSTNLAHVLAKRLLHANEMLAKAQGKK
ncbi:MAG: cyclic nucleotide-binding domain-containing protein [Gammaproteobacteria bacterium]|nr:cyclic nucleotide-binding domain-containing protein [Gammaproteobacteria bacterium]MDH5727980.1 cyclic nucleotide-binding domain-containing protein [Gammaproteobacteria bacterium]